MIKNVILRYLTGLNLDWFKNYGLRRSLRLCASSANSKKIATAKWPCNDLARPFFANYIFIFHKTEIQTVILRCLTSLNLGTKVIHQFEYGSTAHLHKHGGKNNALYTRREHRIIVSRFMHSIINS